MWVSPHLLEFTIHFVGSGCQLSVVFDLRPLSCLEHWPRLTEVQYGCQNIISTQVLKAQPY